MLQQKRRRCGVLYQRRRKRVTMRSPLERESAVSTGTGTHAWRIAQAAPTQSAGRRAKVTRAATSSCPGLPKELRKVDGASGPILATASTCSLAERSAVLLAPLCCRHRRHRRHRRRRRRPPCRRHCPRLPGHRPPRHRLHRRPHRRRRRHPCRRPMPPG